MSELIHATFRTPFDLGPAFARRVQAGMTLLDMAEAMDLPAEWWMPGRGIIAVDGHVIPRAMWRHVRPKPGDAREVRFLFALQGGGDDGKNPLALLASLFLLAVTGFVAGGGLATRFGLSAARFGAGTFGANLTAGLIGLAGNALIGALVGRPGGGQADISAANEAPNTAGIEGNALSKQGPIPRVMGTRSNVFPPFACEPLTYFDGDDEVTEAAYVLAGPHQITDLRLGGALVEDARGVQVEVLEGWPGQRRLFSVTRQSRTEQVGQELRGHALLEDGITTDNGREAGWEPDAFTLATREAPDEYWMALTFPQGLNKNALTDTDLRVPFRLRVRPIGAETWINLPELHYVGASVKPLRTTIKLIWADNPDVNTSAAVGEGWVEARITSPAQTAEPVGGGWTADASFDDGAGDDWLVAGGAETSAVKNVQMSRDEAVIWLDTATFAPGLWEVEITRGVAIDTANYVTADYELSGNVRNLFGQIGGQAPESQKDYIATVGVVRASSIWNEHPVPSDRCAAIGVRVRNREVGRLSCTASGYVRSGAGLTGDYITTSNPAPHFRDAMLGRFNPRPVPVDLVNEADLTEWHDNCAAKGYQINAIVEGGTVRDVLARIAAAGYAVPRMSNEWGVVIGKDTSADAPVQMFTPRNARSISVAKSFPDLPDGLRITFRDAARNDIEREIIYPDTARGGVLLAVEYADRITEAEVLQQAAFDMRELRLRQASISFECAAEALAVRRGDLIELQHDVLDRHAGAGRVIGWAENGSGEVTEITLDATVPVVNEPDVRAVTDIRAVADFRALGRKSAIALRGEDGGPVRSVVPVSARRNLIYLASTAQTSEDFGQWTLSSGGTREQVAGKGPYAQGWRIVDATNTGNPSIQLRCDAAISENGQYTQFFDFSYDFANPPSNGRSQFSLQGVGAAAISVNWNPDGTVASWSVNGASEGGDVIDLGDGLYRAWATDTMTAGGPFVLFCWPASFVGGGTSTGGIILYGAQIERGNQPTAYQKIDGQFFSPVETDTLTLATPLADSGIHSGALVAVGPSSRVTERLIVGDIRRRGSFDAAITCVDEAPELFADH